jgi:hypothetical protein
LKPTLLVMAAGLGSRFGGEKQLEPVGPSGETLLDYSLYDAARAGFGRVVFVVRPDMAERFHEAAGRRYEGRLEVAYVHQRANDLPEGIAVAPGRTKPWGTGQAVLAAASAIDGPFAVANADDFYGADAFGHLGRFLSATRGSEDRPCYALVLYRLRETISPHGAVARGVCSLTPDGLLAGVEEVTAIERDPSGAGFHSRVPGGAVRRFTGDEPVSLNLWGFAPSLFGHLREGFAAFLRAHGHEPKAEFYLPKAVNDLVLARLAEVQTLSTTSHWFGLTYREDTSYVAERLREMTAAGEYPEKLWP